VKLQKLEQVHNFSTKATHSKNTMISGGCFQNGKKNAKPGTVNVFDTFEVEYQFSSGRIKETLQIFLDRF
jgi:hypothetical protein